LYAEIVQFYEGIFGFFSGKAITQQVGDGFNAVLVLNDGG